MNEEVLDFSEEIQSDGNGNIIEAETIVTETEDISAKQEEETENTEEQEEENSDESEKTENESEEETQKESTNEANESSFTYSINGVDIEISNMEEARKALENTKQIPQSQDNWEKIQKDLGLSLDDLSLMSEAKKGSKPAIAKLIKESGIEPEDLTYDEDIEDFVPNYELKEMSSGQNFLANLEKNPAEYKLFSETLEQTDKSFVEGLASNENNMRQFNEHLRNGLAQKIIPAAKKKALLENIDMFQAYIEVGREMSKKENNKKTEDSSKKNDIAKNKGKGTKVEKVTKNLEQEDIDNMTDEEWMKRYGQTAI